MNTVHQIEQAIDTLTAEQLEELYLWLDEKYQQLADARLKAAINQGCFDQIIEQALEDEAASRTTSL